MADLQFNKLANLFPLLEAKDQDKLVEDIKENGQIEPVVLYQGEILDGRNRYLACQKLGIEPKTEEYTGSDPLKYVLSKNLHRRHLTTTQRADIADEIANLSHGGDRVSEQARNSTLAPVSQAQAAEALKVSVDSVKKARKIKREAAPEIIKAVKEGKMSLNAAKKTIPEKQKKAIPAKRMTKAEESAAHQKATGAPIPEFTVEKVKEIGCMPDDTRVKYERRLTSMKATLVELEEMTEYAPQMSQPLRHLLTDELKGIAWHTANIAKKMFGNESLGGLNRPRGDVVIPLREDDSTPQNSD